MAKSRIRTYAGIHFPPMEEHKLERGYLYMQIALKGRIPSKKNNILAGKSYKESFKIIKSNTTNGLVPMTDAYNAVKKVKATIIGNIKYHDYVKEQKEKVLAQIQSYKEKWSELGVIFPLSKAKMKIDLLFVDDYVQDSINKAQTIQDLLVHCKLIEDDNYKCINPVTVVGHYFKDQLRENQALVSISFNIKDNI